MLLQAEVCFVWKQLPLKFYIYFSILPRKEFSGSIFNFPAQTENFFQNTSWEQSFFLLFFFLDCPCIVYFYLLSHLIAFFWCFFGKLFQGLAMSAIKSSLFKIVHFQKIFYSLLYFCRVGTKSQQVSFNFPLLPILKTISKTMILFKRVKIAHHIKRQN